MTTLITPTRLVPLDGALSAAAKASETTADRDEAFIDWFHEPIPEARGGVIDAVALPVDVVERIIATVPDTVMGRAWAEVARSAVAKTKADAWRPFDLIDLDSDPAMTDLVRLTEDLEEHSPLLVPVVDALHAMSAPDHKSIGSYREMADRLTPDGIDLGRPEAIARWDHLDAIRPGTMNQICGLINVLIAALPETAEHDDGRARRG